LPETVKPADKPHLNFSYPEEKKAKDENLLTDLRLKALIRPLLNVWESNGQICGFPFFLLGLAPYLEAKQIAACQYKSTNTKMDWAIGKGVRNFLSQKIAAQ
jgi:hypothetical protein